MTLKKVAKNYGLEYSQVYTSAEKTEVLKSGIRNGKYNMWEVWQILLDRFGYAGSIGVMIRHHNPDLFEILDGLTDRYMQEDFGDQELMEIYREEGEKEIWMKVK